MLTDTPKSLLDRLRVDSSTRDWEVFCNIYRPLIEQKLLYRCFPASDVEDVVQEILARVFVSIPKFQHNGRPGAFRNWLGKIVVQQVWKHRQARAHEPLAISLSLNGEFDAVGAAELEDVWEAEHDQHVLKMLLELTQPEFTRSTWRAFVAVAIDGWSASEAAESLGMTPNAVMIAKSRVLARLRVLGKELLDSL